MKVDRNNIAGFISYLYKKRKQEQPPAELLERWRALSDEAIDQQLRGLFRHWGLTDLEKQAEMDIFLKDTIHPPPPVPAIPRVPVTPRQAPAMPGSVSVSGVKSVGRKPKALRWIVALLLLLPLAYTGYRYVQYAGLGYIYTITDNVAVRNDNKEMVARMDLFEIKNELPSYQKLKAFDNHIYYRSIDKSDKIYPCRKVLLKEGDFWAFLTNRKGIAGYVNTNYVVDNYNEFKLYQTAFKEVKNSKAENTALKAIYRKIIIGSMGLDPGMADKYIVTHTADIPRSAIDRTYAVLKQTIVDNIKYVIIAGLSDGYYYRFEGDIEKNSFTAPEKIMVIDNSNTAVPLSGSYRFFNIGKTAYLYDCKANLPLSFEAVKDEQGKISTFRYKPPVDTAIAPGQDVSDTTDYL